MTPAFYLAFIVAVTFFALISQDLIRSAERRRFRRLATEWKMHYSLGDRLRLAGRIAGHLPTPGAADVRVLDVLFRTEGGRHRYLFTAEYSVGVVHKKRRSYCVAMCTESVRDGRGEELELTIAPADLTRTEQYRHLHGQFAATAIPVL